MSKNTFYAEANHAPFAQPVNVKVHFHEDIFIIQVPHTMEFDDLVKMVGRKIQLCGPRRDGGPLRVKYRDKDGDMVSLRSTEDIQMAFEEYQLDGQVPLFVVWEFPSFSASVIVFYLIILAYLIESPRTLTFFAFLRPYWTAYKYLEPRLTEADEREGEMQATAKAHLGFEEVVKVRKENPRVSLSLSPRGGGGFEFRWLWVLGEVCECRR